MNCDCGETLEKYERNGYVLWNCPKGHYEKHEAIAGKLKDSGWLEDIRESKLARTPARQSGLTPGGICRGTTIADAKVRDAITWAEQQLVALERQFPEASLRQQGWIDGQTELQKLSSGAGVLEIMEAVDAYKQRVGTYLAKWRKKLQSPSG